MKYVLGFDIGTSSAKGVVLDENGAVVAESSCDYEPLVSSDGMSEQNPQDWYNACIHIIKSIEKAGLIDIKQIKAVSVAGQMQGITLIDETGNSVRNSILWNDIRCNAQVDALSDEIKAAIEDKTMLLPNPALTVGKIEWLKVHEPENWNKTYKFLYASNYIAFKLTGRMFTDKNNICFSGLNDLKQNCWSQELIDLLKIEKEKVPDLVDSFDVIGALSKQAALETGLPQGVPVIAGGGDGGAECYAVGIAGTRKMKIRLGTAADLYMVIHSDQFRDVKQWPGIRSVLSDYLMVGSYTKACAMSVKWLRDVFYSEMPKTSETYSLMDADGKKTALGADGLIYHPYLMGENAPYFNANLRAMFHGISAGHNRSHFVRAVYEGVAFSLLDVIKKMDVFSTCESVVLLGGGTKSELWLSILTDVLGMNAQIPKQCDAAYGAALIAGEGANIFKADRIIEESIKKSKKIFYNAYNHQKYLEIFERYLGYTYEQ
jgi:xylulokinase